MCGVGVCIISEDIFQLMDDFLFWNVRMEGGPGLGIVECFIKCIQCSNNVVV